MIRTCDMHTQCQAPVHYTAMANAESHLSSEALTTWRTLLYVSLVLSQKVINVLSKPTTSGVSITSTLHNK